MNAMQTVRKIQKPDAAPDESQRRASDPLYSVWVAASAGSGKTKVLTDRVLRLLLPRSDGGPGTEPHRILCLTFTKAAASEMRLRLSTRLSRWAVADDAALADDLAALLGGEPGQDTIAAARRLFAAVTDAPGGLNIMTIHAFCQSVLGRFPLEAGLPPHFEALDEAAAQYLFDRARNDAVAYARAQPESTAGRALHALAAATSEDGFDALLRNMTSECRALRELINKHGDLARLCVAVNETLGLSPEEDENSILRAAGSDAAFDVRGLREACRVLAEYGTDSTDRPAADAIRRWIDAPAEARGLQWEMYCDAFLTQKGTPRKNLPTKKPQEAFPEITHIIAAETQRIIEIEDRRKAASCATLTRHLLNFGGSVLDKYEEIKTARAALDFDDLINRTLTLLEKPGIAGWVMFKLDGGLDHILVDEAQDTNPEQWRIIAALCGDFFSGLGARGDADRTVFAVGDEKQSIYSFQRAAPEKFRAMRAFFRERVETARRPWREEPMNISFRSVPAILSFVDRVFAPDEVRAGLGPLPLAHESFRSRHAGRVEVWPVFTTPERPEQDAWTPPVTVRAAQGGGARLAEYIGDTIKGWIDSGEIIPSRGRAVQAGDIMVLLRRRSAFVGQLVRALKTRNIPVGGADRMILREQLAVQDLIAAAQFALLPADDLSLACVLKSPLIGWDEDQLEKAAWGRSGTLWDSVQKVASSDVVYFLRNLIAATRTDGRPYAFFSALLTAPCPADSEGGMHAMTRRLGAEAIDPIEEFLSVALSFESQHIPSLQAFLLAFGKSDTEIKREQEESGGNVRIMTVHGAKGLQAPIVILPDSVRAMKSPPGSGANALVWPEKSGLAVPLWSPRRDMDCRLYARVRTTMEERQDEEYRRLMYVALTRAEDRLYICGHAGRKKPMEEHWHSYARRALETMPGIVRIPCPAAAMEDAAVLRFDETPKTLVEITAAPAAAPVHKSIASGTRELAWVHTPAPAQEMNTRPLSPSRATLQPGPAALSPLAAGDTYRFRRGIVTHRLLQFLPEVASSDKREAAARFVARHATDLPEGVQADIVRETLLIFDNPAFAALFGSGSMAEVPFTGIANGRPVSGQIDRLLITDREIWIADYKTNRPPPRNPADIPAAYRTQMQLYRDIVAQIYNERRVRCFLLWTDGPEMMEVHLP